jgi:hypothetical protein
MNRAPTQKNLLLVRKAFWQTVGLAGGKCVCLPYCY